MLFAWSGFWVPKYHSNREHRQSKGTITNQENSGTVGVEVGVGIVEEAGAGEVEDELGLGDTDSLFTCVMVIFVG